MSAPHARTPAGAPVLNSISAFGSAAAARFACIPNEKSGIAIVVDAGDLPWGVAIL
jgi:hypothetical protein